MRVRAVITVKTQATVVVWRFMSFFVLDAGAQRAVVDGADASQLHEYARSRGMRTLYEDGLEEGSCRAQFP